MIGEVRRDPLPLEVLEVKRAISRDISIESERLLNGGEFRTIILKENVGLAKRIIILGKKGIDGSFSYENKGLSLVIRIEVCGEQKENYNMEESYLFYSLFSNEEYVVNELRDRTQSQGEQLVERHEMGKRELEELLDSLIELRETESSKKAVAVQK